MNAEVLIPEIVEGLRALSHESPELFSRVSDSFRLSSGNMVTEMQTALSKRDSIALARTAHSLKGSAGSLGSRRVTALCAELQSTAERGDWSHAQEAMERLPVELEEFRQALAHELV